MDIVCCLEYVYFIGFTRRFDISLCCRRQVTGCRHYSGKGNQNGSVIIASQSPEDGNRCCSRNTVYGLCENMGLFQKISKILFCNESAIVTHP
jgi:hypothetical protein